MAFQKANTIAQPDALRFTDRYLEDVALDYSQYTNELKVYGIHEINNLIENLLLTTPGERPYEPEFGSLVPALIWEPCDILSAHRIRSAIIDPINRWIPYIRINLHDTDCIPYPDRQVFVMTVGYNIRVNGIKGSHNLSLGRYQDTKLVF